MKDSSAAEFDAVVAGYMCVDMAPIFSRSTSAVSLGELLRPGKLVETEGICIALGGVVPNTGLAMLKFGCGVFLNALVGNDVLGDVALRLLARFGSFPGVRRTDRLGTAYGIVLAPPGVDRSFLEYPGCNSIFGAADIDYEAVARSGLFHFGYPPLLPQIFRNNGAELVRILERVEDLGVITSLDLTLPDPDAESGRVDWKAFLANVLPHVQIFTGSSEEALFMLRKEQYASLLWRAQGKDLLDLISQELCQELAGQALELGTTIALLKAGHKGLGVRTTSCEKFEASKALAAMLDPTKWSNRDVWVPAFPVERKRVKNACGAGDAAVAAFLTALLRAESIERAACFAAVAGRDNLYGADALSGLRDWESMEREIVAVCRG